MELSAQKENGELVIKTPRLLKEELDKYAEGTWLTITLERKRSKRTLSQNSAMHKFFTMLADVLNMAGLEMRIVLSGDTQIWWTKDSIKTYLWKKVQYKMFGKEHTADLDKLEEITKVHEQLMHILGERHGVEYIPFPNDPDKHKEQQYISAPTNAYPTDDYKPTSFE